MTQADLVRTTGLASGTVSNIVAQLRSEAILERRGDPSARSPLFFGPRAGVIVGMDLDHRRLRVIVVDQSHAVLGEATHELDVDHEADQAMRTARRATDDLLRTLGVSRADVVGAGMGLSGPLDPVTGEVASSSILPGWVGVPAGRAMTEALGLPVLVDNSANLAALGETVWGAARGCHHMAYVQVGTGIGAGLLLEDRIYRGVYGTAGEIGHTVVNHSGALCRCGSRGCLETVAGLGTLVQLARSHHGPELTATELLALVAAGDIGATRLVADAGEAVGVAVAGLCNLLCPERVVIGGQLATTGDALIEPLRRAAKRNAVEKVARGVDIVLGELGDRAEAMGATALVLRAEALLPADLVPPRPATRPREPSRR